MKLSVIIPAYNEENRISETLRDVYTTLSGKPFEYEILVINDGSKDKTVETVTRLQKEIPKLVLVSNTENHGKGWVTRQGMLEAKGDIRVFMDADNSTRIHEIFAMLPYFEKGCDVVIGSRYIDGAQILVKQPPLRSFLGKALRVIVHTLIPLGIVDSQCGFKAFSAKAVQRIFPQQTVFGWAFDVELLMMARKCGMRIKEIPITWMNNSDSHIKFSGMVNILLEIMRVRIKM